MSWRKSDPIKISREIEKKLLGLEKIETDILETEIIDSGALIINNKNMMISSKEIRLETSENSLVIPERGPIQMSSLSMKISSKEIRLETSENSLVIPERGPIQLSSLSMKISRIELHNNELVLDWSNNIYSNSHFIFESREKIGSNTSIEILPLPLAEKNSEGVQKHFYLDIEPDNFQSFIVKIPSQSLAIKMESPFSFFSLLWCNKWIICGLGYKTIPLSYK